LDTTRQNWSNPSEELQAAGRSDLIQTPILVLASASPRRQELLRNAGISFTACPTNIPEVPLPEERPDHCAERLARAKALAAFRQQPGRLVLGADTIVVVEREILGKPRDPADAARMLRLLSGRAHQVITGVCLIGSKHGGGLFEDARSETTLVTMSNLTDQDVHAYIASGEPMDKAGAYAIQGIASRWIPHIEGDYFNVVGLPVSLVWQMLQECQTFLAQGKGTVGR
jgi:septum formation protein